MSNRRFVRVQDLQAFRNASDEMLPVHIGIAGHVGEDISVVHPRRDHVRVWPFIEGRTPEGQEVFAFVYFPQLPPYLDFSKEALDDCQRRHPSN